MAKAKLSNMAFCGALGIEIRIAFTWNLELFMREEDFGLWLVGFLNSDLWLSSPRSGEQALIHTAMDPPSLAHSFRPSSANNWDILVSVKWQELAGVPHYNPNSTLAIARWGDILSNVAGY